MDKQQKQDVKKNSLAEKIGGFFKPPVKNSNNLELLETDLIKDQVDVKFNWKKEITVFLVLFFIAVVIVAEIFVFLSWWEGKNEIKNAGYLEKEIAYVQEEAETIKGDYELALEFNERLKISSRFLGSHIYWSKFFSFLESNTLKDVYYQSFAGNINGEYVVPAVTNDVRAISFQSRSFIADSMVRSASVSDEEIISSTGVNKTIINFNLAFNLNPRIFNK